MDINIFEATFLFGLVFATIIRSYYGMQFRRKEIINSHKEHPVVFVSMMLWGIALTLPVISIFTSWLIMADYQIPMPLSLSGIFIFILSLWLMWRSHVDLARNFSPSLFIRNNHSLVTYGVYRKIRHPMYLSFWLWAIGQSLLIHNWLAGPTGLVAIVLIYAFRVDREEQQLIEHFGDKYREYQKTTGRILPKL